MDNICCYDKESKLIQSNEVEGGTLQRYHYLGGKSIQPFFDNFYYDVIPFVYCCRYSKHKSKGMGTSNCHQYLRRRPQSSCLHYVPPRPGEYLTWHSRKFIFAFSTSVRKRIVYCQEC